LRNVISEATRKTWERRIKGFWLEFSHNRIGLVGLAMLIFFLIVATFAPLIAPYSVSDVSVASPWHADAYAMPDWITILPQFRDLPPQQRIRLDWAIEQQPPSSINVTKTADMLVLRYNASKTGSYEPVTVHFNTSFNYPYLPMKLWTLEFAWWASPDHVVWTWKETPWGWIKGPQTGSMNYMIKIDLITPNGTSYLIWDQNWWEGKNPVTQIPPAFWNSNSSGIVSMFASLGVLATRQGYIFSDFEKMVSDMFSTKGLYTLRLGIVVKPGEIEGSLVALEDATGEVRVGTGTFIIWGRKFGLLGTDYYGHDVFSQIIHGSTISIIIGVTSALSATLLGVLIGVTAGYLGGWVDEGLMRMVDILICLPLLPVLLVFVAVFGYNVYWLVVLIAIFGWQGLSRVIRSQALSLREMAFVESAISSGATKRYIILRHIVPNVLPTALTAMVLSVPGAIILEAAISFIGMGDPLAPTWGKILYFAQQTQAFTSAVMAWWVVIPPGLAITFLCLTFVFIGHAVDEIVNPKLRRRR